MASLPVYDLSGKKVGNYEIDPADLAPSINKQLLHDVVIMYQASARQGTFGSRSRGMCSGSTKKMYRQKGTGNARAGSRRSNIRRGGGHAFAKKTRDFSFRLPRKAVRLATRMAMAGKVQDEQVVIVDDLKLDAPKTQTIAAMLQGMEIDGKSTVISTAGADTNVYKSARNIDRVSVVPVAELNALEILRPQRLVVTRAAMDEFKERAADAKKKA